MIATTKLHDRRPVFTIIIYTTYSIPQGGRQQGPRGVDSTEPRGVDNIGPGSVDNTEPRGVDNT